MPDPRDFLPQPPWDGPPLPRAMSGDRIGRVLYVMYHVTPRENWPSIKQGGLIPRGGIGEIGFFPDPALLAGERGVYVADYETGIEDFLFYVWLIHHEGSPRVPLVWYILLIKVPGGVPVTPDPAHPQSITGAWVVHQEIPPQYIRPVGWADISTWNLEEEEPVIHWFPPEEGF